MLWHTIPDGGADGETEREEGERERRWHQAGGFQAGGIRPVGSGRWDYIFTERAPPIPFELKGSRAEEEK